jgi:hypothetical protein
MLSQTCGELVVVPLDKRADIAWVADAVVSAVGRTISYDEDNNDWTAAG